MAGVYGEIDSRVDYHRVLREAADIARRILARNPGNSAMQRIDKELDAMRRWTEGGRDPSASERTSIAWGLSPWGNSRRRQARWPSLLSLGTEIADFGSNVFNTFPAI